MILGARSQFPFQRISFPFMPRKFPFWITRELNRNRLIWLRLFMAIRSMIREKSKNSRFIGKKRELTPPAMSLPAFPIRPERVG